MTKLRTIGLMVAMAVVGLSGCGGDDSADASEAISEAANKYEISQLQVKWHEGHSTKDLDLVMSLFAEDAVFSLAGQTLTGREQIRNFLATRAAPLRPENNWTALHPAFKVRITTAEDRGTLHFFCHWVDPDTQEFKAHTQGDVKVARVDGRWLFTNFVATNATL